MSLSARQPGAPAPAAPAAPALGASAAPAPAAPAVPAPAAPAVPAPTALAAPAAPTAPAAPAAPLPPAAAPASALGAEGRPVAVRLDDVTVGYGTRVALANVTLSVPQGSLLAVVGPNGAGKSTLIKVMAGLLEPWSGRVQMLGSAARANAKRIAYLPQAELVDWQFPVSVGDVVMMGRYPLIGIGRRPGGRDRELVRRALETVKMDRLAERQIGALSGGQRRRVFLARALAAEPDLYLLDEPVTGVDATTQEDLMDVLEAEARAGKTVIATTHDLLSAAQRFHDVAFVNRRLVALGPAASIFDQQLLTETYGGHVLILQTESGTAVALDDAHHHDEPGGHERHYHEGGG